MKRLKPLFAILSLVVLLSSCFSIQTEEPYLEGTANPTIEPTMPEPTKEPTIQPTIEPTQQPTAEPTTEPTIEPTTEPTTEPTKEPTTQATAEPTVEPTAKTTPEPTAQPTPQPTPQATPEPTPQPTIEPTPQPAVQPTNTEPENNEPLETEKPTLENPSAGDKRPTSVDDLLDNPFIAKMVEAEGSGYHTGDAVTEAWMDGIRLMCGFESETGYFFAFSANGAITNAMPLLKEMVGAWVTSSADINEIFTLLEKRQQEVEVVNAKWTEEGSLINEMWYGSDSDHSKYVAELEVIRAKYKITSREDDEVDIWQKTSGGVEFAFVWQGGFRIIIK